MNRLDICGPLRKRCCLSKVQLPEKELHFSTWSIRVDLLHEVDVSLMIIMYYWLSWALLLWGFCQTIKLFRWKWIPLSHVHTVHNSLSVKISLLGSALPTYWWKARSSMYSRPQWTSMLMLVFEVLPCEPNSSSYLFRTFNLVNLYESLSHTLL